MKYLYLIIHDEASVESFFTEKEQRQGLICNMRQWAIKHGYLDNATKISDDELIDLYNEQSDEGMVLDTLVLPAEKCLSILLRQEATQE